MKFAFLVALLIALVAVSSAAWTIVAPVADAKWTEGTVVTLQFKTDAAVEVKDTFSFTAVDDDAADAFWAPNAFAVKGQGSFQYCTVGDKIVATVAGKTLSFIEEVAIDATVSCSVRVALGAATPVVVTAGEDSVDVEIVASAAKVEVVSASANDDRSTAVELKFSGLVANSIVGPVTFGYKFEKSAAAGVGITASPLFYNQFLASDYATVVFGEDVRMLWQGTQAWIVTGDKFADSTLALEYFDYELTAAVVTDDRGKDYSVWAVIDGATPATGDKTLLKVATVQTVEANTASITRAAGTITYGQQVKVTADKPMWSFSISDYDADTVFGAGATLQYIVGGAAKQLTFTDKKFEYELTDAKANDVVVVTGSFKVTDDWTKLTKFESSVGGKSASAQLATACTVTKVEIGSLTEGVIDYTLTVGGDKDFKGEVSCDRSYASALNQLVGDIRAAGEYTPSCEGTGASVSVDDKVTKDDADVNRRRLSISATLADGSKTATVKCTQKIGDAASKRSSKTVALNVDTVTATKDLLTAAATVKDRRQKITVKSRAITDSATFTAVLGEVVTALKVYDEENFKDLAVGDFHYTTDLQTYSAGTQGFDFLFKTFANEYSNQGSQLTLVFTATNQPDAAVTGTTLYGAGFEYSFTSLVDGTYEGFEAPAVYLDGSVDATYLANQFVQHGLGVKCATTQQCTGGYCNKAVCTPLTQLTFAQQAAITGADGSTSASSALFTGLALLLAVIAIFA